jgi:hypothetical protein
LLSPTHHALPPFPGQLDQNNYLARLASSLQTIHKPQTTAADLLFNQSLNPQPSTTASNNNNYKDSLSNLLMEQQLIQNLQKLHQLLQQNPTPPNPLNLIPQPPQQPSINLLSQLQLGPSAPFGNLLQSVLPPPQPIVSLPNNLTASLAAALNDLARQNGQAFLGN